LGAPIAAIYTYVAAFAGIPVALPEQIATSTPIVVEQVVEEVVVPEMPVLRDQTLVRICSCESTGSADNEPAHYDTDGSVLRGRLVPQDTGMCQINTYYWGADAQRLGFDLETPEGNIHMANYIYDRSGTQPWLASKSCWIDKA
jgi:hypothetical protein